MLRELKEGGERFSLMNGQNLHLKLGEISGFEAARLSGEEEERLAVLKRLRTSDTLRIKL